MEVAAGHGRRTRDPDESRRLIHGRAAEADLRDHARTRGMKGLREDGLRWVRAGETSLEEVLRVSRE